MHRRGKLLAISTVAVSVAVLITAVLVAWPRFQEEWWLQRLKTGDVQEQVCAARRLGKLRSVRAIHFLFGVFGEVAGRRPKQHNVEIEEGAIRFPFNDRVHDADSKANWELWKTCALSLYKIACTTLPGVEQGLLQALRDDSPAVREYSCVLLGSTNRPSAAVVPALRYALQDNTRAVRRAANHSLNKIQDR